jgi:hypothetical protein
MQVIFSGDDSKIKGRDVVHLFLGMTKGFRHVHTHITVLIATVMIGM